MTPRRTLRRTLLRRAAVFAAGALVLGGLLLATLGVGAWRVRAVAAADLARAQDATVAHVRDRLAGLAEQMRQQAEAVAALPEVEAALAGGSAGVDGPALAALGRVVRPERTSVEVVSAAGNVVAWDGPVFPRLVGPPPDSLLTRVVADDASRRALVLWRPVVRDGAVAGAVRVVRVVQTAVPVRNRYLQDYDVADEWGAGAPVPFVVRFSERGDGAPLVGPDGSALGRVEVGRPTAGALAAVLDDRVGAVAAFWAVLLVGWGVDGLAGAFLLAVRLAERRPTRGRWARAGGALVGLVAGLAAVRYGLLALDVPVRWLDGARRPAALFDPALLASDLAGGRQIGRAHV